MFPTRAIIEYYKLQLFVLVSFVLFIGISGLILLDLSWAGPIIPILLFVIYLALYAPKKLFFLLFFFIPLSIEWEFSNGLSTDVPGELLLWLLLGITTFGLIWKGVPKKLLRPIGFLLLVSLIWMAICVVFSENQFISGKSFLAKIWYVIPVVALPLLLFKTIADWENVFRFYIAGLFLGAVYFFLQHYSFDLAFDARGYAGSPIWRNHVNYACALVIGLPICSFLISQSKGMNKKVYSTIFLLLLIFCFFSYARVTYLCILIMTLAYFIIKKSLLKFIALISLLVMLAAGVYLKNENRYLSLAPVYERAITQTEFDHLVYATYQKEDISSMERIYRWVAGINMIKERPILGFGPASFYNVYQKYSVNSFKTYVSDNPDHSGIHNYYLMLAAEQGLPGLILFLWLVYLVLLKAQFLYHQLEQKMSKNLVMTAALVFIAVLVMNSINDLIEVIKVGVFFYLTIALFLWMENKESTLIAK